MRKYFGSHNIVFLHGKLVLFLICMVWGVGPIQAGDGYGLWLNYEKIKDKQCLASYQNMLRNVYVLGNSPTMELAKEELAKGLSGLLDKNVRVQHRKVSGSNRLIVASQNNLSHEDIRLLAPELAQLRDNGFFIKDIRRGRTSSLYVVGQDDVGTLYGVFHLLRLLQTHTALEGINEWQQPKV